jgi:hypothetical protein
MGWIDDDKKAWLASPQYVRSQEILAQCQDRVDMDRVIICCGSDIVLAEQDAEVGYDGWDFYVEVTGTLGVRVGDVFKRYLSICYLIRPDFAVNVPWSQICDDRDDYYFIPDAEPPRLIPEQEFRVAPNY